MTQQEATGGRPSPFSEFSRMFMPDSYETCHRMHDNDWIIWNKAKKLILFMEEKTFMAEPKSDQGMIFKLIHNWMGIGIEGWNKLKNDNWTWKGYHLLQWETDQWNSQAYFDRKKVTKEQLIKLLSL